MRRFHVCASLVLVFLLASCGAKQDGFDERPAEESSRTDDIKLAEAVVRAKSYVFRHDRDPFRPLEKGGSVVSPQTAGSAHTKMIPESDILLHGIISSGGVSFAVLETGGTTKLYKSRENAGGYFVETVEEKKVILKQGSDTLELNVGGQPKR